MEQPLRLIAKEVATPSGEREKKLKDCCERALALFEQTPPADKRSHLKESWNTYLQPFQLGIGSRSARIACLSLQGLQAAALEAHKASDDGVNATGPDTVTSGLFLSAARQAFSAANLPEEVQLEHIKVVLSLVGTGQMEIHGNLIVQAFQVCVSTGASSAHQTTIMAAKAAILQLVHIFTEQLREAFNEEESSHKGNRATLLEDFLLLLRRWTAAVHNFPSIPANIGSAVCTQLYEIEALQRLLASTPPAVGSHSDVLVVVRDQLVPGLITLLATLPQLAQSRHFPGTAHPAIALARAATPAVHGVVAELVHLVGSIMSMRPAITALLHRALLTPSPDKRADAMLGCLKELLASPDYLLSLAGPVQGEAFGEEPPTHHFSVGERDLLHQLMQGVVASVKSESRPAQRAAVVTCTTLVTSLEQLLEGKKTIRKETAKRLQAIAPPSRQSSEIAGDVLKPISSVSVSSLHNEVGESSSDQNSPSHQSGSHIQLVNGHSPDDGQSSEARQASTDSQQVESEQLEERGRPTSEEDSMSATSDVEDAGDSTAEQTTLPSTQLRMAGPSVAPGNAHLFVQYLLASLPNVLRQSDPVSVDESIQKLASSFCSLSSMETPLPVHVSNIDLQEPPATIDETMQSDSQLSVLTADSVYVAVYTALAMNLRHQLAGFYDQPSTARLPVVSQEAFFEELSSSGVVLCLAPRWAEQLYRLVLYNDFLSRVGYSVDADKRQPSDICTDQEVHDCPVLVSLLYQTSNLLSSHSALLRPCSTDCDTGVASDDGSNEMPNSDSTSSFNTSQLLQFKEVHPPISSLVEVKTREYICAELLEAVWQPILQVLHQPLTVKPDVTVSFPSLARAHGIFSVSQGALQMIKHQSSSGKQPEAVVFSCLSGLRCLARLTSELQMRQRCAEVLSTLASTACRDVPKVDHVSAGHPTVSSSQGSSMSSGKLTTGLSSIRQKITAKKTVAGGSNAEQPGSISESHTTRTQQKRLQLSHVLSIEALFNLGLQSAAYAPQCWQDVLRCCAHVTQLEADVFAFPAVGDEHSDSTSVQSPSLKTKTLATITSLVESEGRDLEKLEGYLSPEMTAQAVQILSSEVERLFHNAGHRLNLPAAVVLARELCASSREQLRTQPQSSQAETPGAGDNVRPSSPSGNHLASLSHLKQFAPFFTASCAEKSCPLVHVLRLWAEVSPHLVEAACHGDRRVSKLAVDCLHQLAAQCLQTRPELPHFTFHRTLLKPMETLIALQLSDSDTQDQVVCSLCELVEATHVQIGSGWQAIFAALRAATSLTKERRSSPIMDIIAAVLGSGNAALFSDAALDCIECLQKFLACGHKQPSQFAEKALKNVKLCYKLLGEVYKLKTYPPFRGAGEIHLPKKVLADGQTVDSVFSVSTNNSGLLQVWFFFVQGLFDGFPLCPAAVQPHVVDEVFGMLKQMWHGDPGKPFAMAILQCVVLPALLTWLKHGIRLGLHWPRTDTSSFKHATGCLIEFAQEELIHLACEAQETSSEAGDDRQAKEVSLRASAREVVQAIFSLLVDTIIQPEETLCTMGNASLRHLLLSCGDKFSADLWQATCSSLCQALTLTLEPVQMVLAQFGRFSVRVSGYREHVKVTCKRNMNVATAFRVLHLAKQVFILPSELRSEGAEYVSSSSPSIHDEELHSTIENCSRDTTHGTDSFSFFWLEKASDEGQSTKKMRVPFRTLTVSLVTHQLLLHTLADIILGEGNGESIEEQCYEPAPVAASFLKRISPTQLDSLLDCLLKSCQVACAFSSRPGLQALVLKVGALEPFTPHLLRQATACLRLYVRCLLSLCCVNNEQLSQWFTDTQTDERSADTLLIGKPQLLADPPSVRSKSGEEGEGQISRACGVTGESVSGEELGSFGGSLAARRVRLDGVLAWLNNRDSPVPWLWVASRSALVTQLLVDYVSALHGRSSESADDSATEASGERDGSNVTVTQAVHSVLLPQNRLIWYATEKHAWGGVVLDLLQWMRTIPTDCLRNYLPAFYPALTDLLLAAEGEQLSRALHHFLCHVGGIHGFAPANSAQEAREHV